MKEIITKKVAEDMLKSMKRAFEKNATPEQKKKMEGLIEQKRNAEQLILLLDCWI